MNRQMQQSDKIYVAGHRGMVGSAIMRHLKKVGYENFITKTRSELDLTNQLEVNKFFETEKPDVVFLAAAKVGGILANNTYRADFIRDNLVIQTNIIHASYTSNVKKLLFLGSSCIYPKMAKQPIKEEYLLSGYLEPTNEPYAVAKIAGIKMCDAYNKQYATNYISVMPTNLYGPGDNYDLQNSHVLPALIRKMHEAKVNKQNSVAIWGTGKPCREFLYCEDLADACVFLMENCDASDIGECINIGVGKDISIADLAKLVADVVGFKGELVFDTSKPDGTPRKLLDVGLLNQLGWSARTDLEKGIGLTYQDFLVNHSA